MIFHDLKTGDTPLHISCSEGYKTVALTLLDHNAQINSQNKVDGLSDVYRSYVIEWVHSTPSSMLPRSRRSRGPSLGERSTYPAQKQCHNFVLHI